MNPLAVLALLGSLFEQLAAAQNRAAELEVAIAGSERRVAELEASLAAATAPEEVGAPA